MIVFTLELLCRAPAHTTMRGFVFRRPAVFVDFLACIPFDFYLFFGLHWSVLDTRWLRPVRLLRIVSLGDHIFQLRLILTGIRRSLWMIALVWSLVLLVLFSFASVLFMAERGAWDSSQRCYLSSAGRCSDYESVPTSLYFSLEVVSSLGYGDIVPLSAIGHLITMLLMLVSVSIIALTVTVFSIQFERVHGKTKRDIFVKTLREAADLRLRMAIFENNDVTLQLTSEATCRLVTAIEILQAIARDLSETAKAVRGDLMLMSQHGTTTRNPHLDKKGFAAISELAIAQLAAVAYNDIDTLTEFILTTSQDLFVQIAGSFDAGQYMLAPYDSPR
jgi:voltage-gated potassium channel